MPSDKEVEEEEDSSKYQILLSLPLRKKTQVLGMLSAQTALVAKLTDAVWETLNLPILEGTVPRVTGHGVMVWGPKHSKPFPVHSHWQDILYEDLAHPKILTFLLSGSHTCTS